jgi:hypothetical protein
VRRALEMRGTAMPAPQGSFIPNALLILELARRIVKRACVVLVVGLLAGLASPLTAQVPLCVLELWTDSPVYSLDQTVSVFARLQVGEEAITGARFQIEVRTQEIALLRSLLIVSSLGSSTSSRTSDGRGFC